MKVIDLADDQVDLFSLCLEDWSEEARESGPSRRRWLDESMASRGLRAKVALDDDGTVGGMIQYGPVEHAHVAGEGLYFIYCIHVHGYSQGRGNFQGRGMGTALLKAAEEDARALGATGMAAWGVWLPFWMRAAWFRRHGYRRADRQGLAMLVWKPFTPDASPPRWIKQRLHLPEPVSGKVNVTACVSGWCMAQNLVCERARRAAATFGDSVVFQEVALPDRTAVARYGTADAVYIDGQNVQKGPPPSYDAIRKAIARRLLMKRLFFWR